MRHFVRKAALCLEIKDIKVCDLKEYENNPRHNEEAVEAVAESIKQYGFKVPIILDRNGVIVAGHTRKRAAELLGLETVPCYIAADLTPEQVKAYRLADNKTGELAEWDFEKLEQELAELTAFDVDMSLFGFDESDFENLFEENSLVEEEEIPTVEDIIESRVKSGDVWKLGRHTLICGDSTKQETVNKLMDGAAADLWLTDPPYNVNYEGATKEKLTIQNDNLSDREFYEFLKNSFSAAETVLKAGGGFYIWHADSEGYNFRKACKDTGLNVRQCLIWNKNALILGRQDYQWKHEPCLYGWKDGAAHYFTNDRTLTTVLDFDKPQRNGEHPTMKPVELFAQLIGNSTKKGGIVLDTFGGSGTTLIACEQLDRVCYMSELDPKYCEVIVKRWETLTGEKAERITRKAA